MVRAVRRAVRRRPEPATRDSPSGIAVGSFGSFDVAYRRGTADEQVIQHSFDDDIFFARVPEYVPRDGDIVLDVGAHIGTFSLLAASRVGGGRVYAVEASEDSYTFLRINAALNDARNIVTSHVALDARAGTVTLYHDAGNWGHSTVARLSSSTESVAALPLAAYLDANGIDRCDFAKFNCEGAEFPILLATPAGVLRRFGVMLVLYHNDLWERNPVDDLVRHLAAAGFSCQIRHATPTRGWLIATR